MEPRQDQLLIAPEEFDFILAMNCRGRLRIARIALSRVASGTNGTAKWNGKEMEVLS
jgi:hypothetical protein